MGLIVILSLRHSNTDSLYYLSRSTQYNNKCWSWQKTSIQKLFVDSVTRQRQLLSVDMQRHVPWWWRLFCRKFITLDRWFVTCKWGHIRFWFSLSSNTWSTNCKWWRDVYLFEWRYCVWKWRNCVFLLHSNMWWPVYWNLWCSRSTKL
jgi:hypothetical protein